jgi:hypothetical protein
LREKKFGSENFAQEKKVNFANAVFNLGFKFWVKFGIPFEPRPRLALTMVVMPRGFEPSVEITSKLYGSNCAKSEKNIIMIIIIIVGAKQFKIY